MENIKSENKVRNISLEEELRESEAKYRDLFENVAQGIIISTRDGSVVDCNRALLEMLEYDSRDEFLSINLENDLYMVPGDRKKFQRDVEKKGSVKDYGALLKKKNGEPLNALFTISSRYDSKGDVIGYQGLIVDVTIQKKMERDIRAANQFLVKLIDSTLNSIVATNMKGEILIFNTAAEKLLGYKSDEVIGKMNITDIYPPGVGQDIMQKMRSPEQGGVGILRSLPIVQKNREGESIDGLLSASILYGENDEEIASVGIFTDLRPIMVIENKLRNTQLKLMQSEKLSAMGRLTSQIAHELNNPLYGIMNTLDLLKSEVPETSKRRRLLDMALSETKRITDMLRSMLIFAKPSQEEKKDLDINTLLDNIILFFEKQLVEANVSVEQNLNPDMPTVYASQNQIIQVILNILNNAKHAMPGGGKLKIDSYTKDGSIFIDITDTGTGIKDDIKDKIFDAFFTTKSEVKGVGLGLSVCYGIIKDHNGDIKVESEEGKGTTFSIILPVNTKPDEENN